MILNSRQNSFFINFPADFFNSAVQEKYSKYYRNLLLPYKSLPDFMASTVQSVNFPGFSSVLPTQTRTLGKTQELQSSKPIADQFTRELKVTFKLTDAYLNYFIFLDNALNYLDPANVSTDNTGRNSLGQALSVPAMANGNHPFFQPIRLTLLNNEGYAVSSIIFNRPMLTSLSEMNLSYSSITPQFTTFTATFKYYNFDLELDFD
jgi:hypothetical protein